MRWVNLRRHLNWEMRRRNLSDWFKMSDNDFENQRWNANEKKLQESLKNDGWFGRKEIAFSLETSLFFTNFSISKLCCLKQSYSSNPSMTNWVLNSSGQPRIPKKIAIVRLMMLQAHPLCVVSNRLWISDDVIKSKLIYFSQQYTKVYFTKAERVVNIPRRMKKVSCEILYCERWCLVSHPSPSHQTALITSIASSVRCVMLGYYFINFDIW